MAKDNPNIREAKIIETEKICLNSYFSLEVKLCTQITHLKEFNKEGTVHRLLDQWSLCSIYSCIIWTVFKPHNLSILHIFKERFYTYEVYDSLLRSGINTKIKKTVSVC